MAKEETPKDITPIKRKGIEMAVKGLSKTYPFVIGYTDDTTDQYVSSHYIDLIIDLNKLSEYTDVPVNPYWKQYVEENPKYEKIYTLFSYLKFDREYEYGDYNDHPGYKLQQDVVQLLGTIYEYLPEQYKLYYESESSFNNQVYVYPVSLKVNGYLMR
jgi:hypothetical protein